MYSWRRDALSDMQARPGTEQARNLAGHKHNSEAIGAYTHRITTDFDVTAFRIQDSGYEPQQLRDIWRQSHSAIYQPSTTGPDLRSVLQERVEAQVVLRKDWEELNQAVKVVTRLLGLIALLTDSRTCFQKLRRSPICLPENDPMATERFLTIKLYLYLEGNKGYQQSLTNYCCIVRPTAKSSEMRSGKVSLRRSNPSKRPL